MSGPWYRLTVLSHDALGRESAWQLCYDQSIRDRLEAGSVEASVQLARVAASLVNGTYRTEPPGFLVAPRD